MATLITIREKHFAGDAFTIVVSFDGVEEQEQLLNNPYDEARNKLLEWDFEEYISKPFDDVKVKDAVKAIEDYGQNLFNSIFTGDILLPYRNAL